MNTPAPLQPANRSRALLRLIREEAHRRGLSVDAFSSDWLLRIRQGNAQRFIFGYDFDLNTAAAQHLCKDKAATAEILADADIPHVPHRLFLHPREAAYLGSSGNWDGLLAYAEEHAFQLVCKPNDGTGGRDVLRVTDQRSLEDVVHYLFHTVRAIAVCPFLSITAEYRIILLDGTPLLAYEKRRAEAPPNRTAPPQPLGTPEQSEWRHNLGLGATPHLVPEGDLRDLLLGLAKDAAQAVGIRFASVDLVRHGDAFDVLEINSGVMLEAFVRLHPDGEALARGIYGRALDALFPPLPRRS